MSCMVLNIIHIFAMLCCMYNIIMKNETGKYVTL